MSSGGHDGLCPILTVTRADYADCNGVYKPTRIALTNGKFRQIYRNTRNKNRFIFFIGRGYGWSIGRFILVEIIKYFL